MRARMSERREGWWGDLVGALWAAAFRQRCRLSLHFCINILYQYEAKQTFHGIAVSRKRTL